MRKFREDMIDSLQYNFITGTGTLRCPRRSYPHMPAVTRLFESIDPKVKVIEVYDGPVHDLRYSKEGGKWICYRMVEVT